MQGHDDVMMGQRLGYWVDTSKTQDTMRTANKHQMLGETRKFSPIDF